MSGMERFTQRARRVLSLAHQEAERMRQNVIGTEHLLLGLIEEEGGVAGSESALVGFLLHVFGLRSNAGEIVRHFLGYCRAKPNVRDIGRKWADL